MSKRIIIGLTLALLTLGACSTGQVLGTGAGAAGGYAVDGKRGAVIGGVGGGLLGGALD
jgi:osmotically inducible lipoprotein OsmB